MNALASFDSGTPSYELDRLSRENIQLKSKIIQLEQCIDPEVSSIQESTFAMEIHQQLKQRDNLLEKAKISILSLQNETQMNSAMMEEKQSQIQSLQNQIKQLTQEKQQLEADADMYQKQRDLKENELVLAKTKIQDLQSEVSQSKFLIQNLHYRMNPDLNQEPSANTTTEQLWKDHLKAVTHQMEAKMQEVQKKFSQNMDNVYQDKQDALQQAKKDIIQLESNTRQLQQEITDLKCVNVSLEEQNKHLNQQLKTQQNIQIELVHTQNKLNEEILNSKNLQLQNEQWNEKQKLLNAQNQELNSTLVNKNMLIEKCREKILKLSEGLKESLKENDALEKLNKDLQGKQMESESIIRANQKIMSDQETEISTNKKTLHEQKVQLDVLNNTVFELQQNLKRLQVNHDELQQIYDEKERDYNAYKNNFDNMKQAHDKLSNLQQEQTAQMELLSKQKQNNQSEIEDLTARVKQYQQELQQNLEKFTEVSVQNGNLQTQVTELTTKLTELTSQKQINDIETDNNKQTIQLLQQQVIDLKDVNQRLQNDFDQVSLNYNVLKQQSGAQTTQLQENTNITTDLRRKNSIMAQQLAQITQIMQEMAGQSMIESLTKSYHTLDSSMKNDKIVDQLNHFQAKFNELQNSLSDKKMKLQTLQETNATKDETLKGIQLQLDANIQQITQLNQLLKEKNDQLSQVTREYEQLKLQSDQNNLTLNQAVEQRNKLKEYQQQMKERIEKQDQIIKRLKEERSQLQKNVAAEVASATSVVRKAVQEFTQQCLSQNDIQVIRQEAIKLMEKINQ